MVETWNQGRATVDQLMAENKIEAVPPNLEAAVDLIAKAHTHLRSAALLADSDTELAFDALHAANRKALTAVLLVQGLRPTREGGHTSVFEAVRAQVDPPLGATLLPYSRIRRTRNAGDYLTALPPDAADVHAELPSCEAIVSMAQVLITKLPPY